MNFRVYSAIKIGYTVEVPKFDEKSKLKYEFIEILTSNELRFVKI